VKANTDPTFEQAVARAARQLEVEMKKLDAMILESKKFLATDLAFLEGKRAEMQVRYDDLTRRPTRRSYD
jgi:hypothetical protein